MTTHPVSPNTVLANALQRAEDVLTPRILATPPERIVLVVGTQINGAPRIGTSLVQSLPSLWLPACTIASASPPKSSSGPSPPTS